MTEFDPDNRLTDGGSFSRLGARFSRVIKNPFVDGIITSLALVGLKNKLQEFFLHECGVYVPNESVYTFIIGGLLCTAIWWLLVRRKLPGIIDRTRALVLQRGTRKRQLVIGALVLCTLLTVGIPYWLYRAYHHPARDERAFLIYIDAFDVAGWNSDKLVLDVKRALQRELKELLPVAEVVVLEAPRYIGDQDDRLDWACEKGAKIVIYATGNADEISPHIKLCTHAIPPLPVFIEDTVNFALDLPTAASVVRSSPRYQLLAPPEAIRLCVVELLTPKACNYLATLALGLCCLYDNTIYFSQLERYQRADALLEKAVSLGSDTLGCNLNYCEALALLGKSKLLLAASLTDSAAARRILCAADSVLSAAIRCRPDLAGPHLDRIYVLGLLGQPDRAAALCDEGLRSMDNRGDLIDSELVANTLLTKGFMLALAGQNADVVAVCDEIVQRFGKSSRATIQECIVHALVSKGLALSVLGRTVEAAAVYDTVLTRYQDNRKLAVSTEIARAFYLKGITNIQLHDDTEAIAALNEVVRRFEQDANPDIRRTVAQALFHKALLQEKSGDTTEAIVAHDELASHFANDCDPVIKEQVAKSFVNKGAILCKKDQGVAAVAVYDEFLRRFEADTTAAIRGAVARTLANKGWTLWGLRHKQDAITSLCAAWGLRAYLNAKEIEALRQNLRSAGLAPDDCP